MTVSLGGRILYAGSDYTVEYSANRNAGIASVIVKGKGGYSGVAYGSFTISAGSAQPSLPDSANPVPSGKLSNAMTVAKASKTLKYAKLKKKAQTLKLFTVKNAQGMVTYTLSKVSKSAKKFSMNRKTGKLTVKKGTAKGTYKLTVKVTAAGNAAYNSATLTVKGTVKVK